MLGHTADNGLVDRTLIELGLDSGIDPKLRCIEHIVSWSRDRWHPKIAEYLNKDYDYGQGSRQTDNSSSGDAAAAESPIRDAAYYLRSEASNRLETELD